MGYYSLRYPIHNNDIINNGARGLLASKKKMELLIFKSSVTVSAFWMKRGESGG